MAQYIQSCLIQPSWSCSLDNPNRNRNRYSLSIVLVQYTVWYYKDYLPPCRKHPTPNRHSILTSTLTKKLCLVYVCPHLCCCLHYSYTYTRVHYVKMQYKSDTTSSRVQWTTSRRKYYKYNFWKYMFCTDERTLLPLQQIRQLRSVRLTSTSASPVLSAAAA